MSKQNNFWTLISIQNTGLQTTNDGEMNMVVNVSFVQFVYL